MFIRNKTNAMIQKHNKSQEVGHNIQVQKQKIVKKNLQIKRLAQEHIIYHNLKY